MPLLAVWLHEWVRVYGRSHDGLSLAACDGFACLQSVAVAIRVVIVLQNLKWHNVNMQN